MIKLDRNTKALLLAYSWLEANEYKDLCYFLTHSNAMVNEPQQKKIKDICHKLIEKALKHDMQEEIFTFSEWNHANFNRGHL